ncbi:MAG: universal stress protein [Acidimicrobiia bacterium]
MTTQEHTMPATETLGTGGCLVLGVDGTPGSRRAAEYATHLAAALDAPVVAIFALRPAAEFLLDLPPSSVEEWTGLLERELRDDWCRPLAKAGIPYTTQLVEREPVAALIDAADRHRAAMIVVGANHHGSLHRLAGSKIARLVHEAHRPVVVVPPERGT